MEITSPEGSDDTGETDVNRLRRDLSGDDTDLPESALRETQIPHVGDKHDVPYEGALPDLYRLFEQEDASDEDIEQALLRMVDAGELCFGWDEERQEFSFWAPEEFELEPEEAPAEPQMVISAPARHRQIKPRRIRYRKALLGLIASITTPLAIGATASAMEGHRMYIPVLDIPDSSVDEIPANLSSTVAELPPAPVQKAVMPTHPAASPSPKAKHAKHVEAEAPEPRKAYTGRHRKEIFPAAPAATHAATPTAPPTVDRTAPVSPPKTVVSPPPVTVTSTPPVVVPPTTPAPPTPTPPAETEDPGHHDHHGGHGGCHGGHGGHGYGDGYGGGYGHHHHDDALGELVGALVSWK